MSLATAECLIVADAASEEARLRTAAYRELLCAEYEVACAVADARGRPPPAYPSQVVKANEILAAFAEDVSLVTFVASPQWGKTGVILYLTYALAGLPIGRGVPEALAARPVDPEQVYVFTGMSDTDWTRQTKSRMLPSLAECVTHRNGIPAMFARRAAPGGPDGAVGGLRDALIILDECHLASESSQTLSDALRRIGVLDYGALRERNVRILCISATPVHMLLDATGWGSVASRTVIATEGDGYLSFADLLAEDRVRDAASVEQDALIALVRERWGDDDPKYHIVRQIDRRAPTAAASIASAINSAAAAASTVGVVAGAGAGAGEIVRKFSAAAFRAAGFAVSNHNSASRLGDVDELLKRRPDRHHVIFIKGFWRASKTFPDDHIGVCYESASDHTTILQGLAGRLLGHGKKRGPRAPFLFCDPEPIRSYNDWLASGCDYRTYAAYRSRLLKIAKGQVLKKRESTVHPNVVAGLPEPDGAPAGAAAAANPAAPAMPRGPSLARVGEVSPAAARGPATFAATTMTVYATRAAFLEAIGVPEQLRPDEWPARAQDLSALLKITRALASLNVSYNDNSARDVSNLLNYGSASRAKSWASADTQVIWIKERDPEEVIVIRKDLAGLQRALAEDAADPARTRRVVAHNYLKRTILYEIVR